MKVSINLNDRVRFRPTEYGERVLEDHYRNLGISLSLLQKKDKDGYLNMQLYSFIDVYGPASFVGGQPFVVENTLEFEGESK